MRASLCEVQEPTGPTFPRICRLVFVLKSTSEESSSWLANVLYSDKLPIMIPFLLVVSGFISIKGPRGSCHHHLFPPAEGPMRPDPAPRRLLLSPRSPLLLLLPKSQSFPNYSSKLLRSRSSSAVFLPSLTLCYTTIKGSEGLSVPPTVPCWVLFNLSL